MKEFSSLFFTFLLILPRESFGEMIDDCSIERYRIVCENVPAPSTDRLMSTIEEIVFRNVRSVVLYMKDFPALRRVIIDFSFIECDEVTVPPRVVVLIDRVECDLSTKAPDHNKAKVNTTDTDVVKIKPPVKESLSQSENQERCHSAWIYNDEGCYLFMGDFTMKRDQADQLCQNVGAQLVSLSTEDRDREISKLLKQRGSSTNWWTSGQLFALCGTRRKSRVSTTPMWTWNTTNGLIGFAHKNFFDGRDSERSYRERKCLRISQDGATVIHPPTQNFTWYSSSCDRTASPMCTKPACPVGWHSFAMSQCMRVVEVELNFDDQVGSCQRKEGELLRINSYPEYRTVTGILKKLYGASSYTFGIDGGKYIGVVSDDVFSRPGREPSCVTPCSKRIVDFAPWFSGQPKFFAKNGSDVVHYVPRFSISRSKDGAWKQQTGEVFGFSDHERSAEMRFICERSLN